MSDDADDSVTHYEITPKRSACGRKLPTRGFFTDDLKEFVALSKRIRGKR